MEFPVDVGRPKLTGRVSLIPETTLGRTERSMFVYNIQGSSNDHANNLPQLQEMRKRCGLWKTLNVDFSIVYSQSYVADDSQALRFIRSERSSGSFVSTLISVRSCFHSFFIKLFNTIET